MAFREVRGYALRAEVSGFSKSIQGKIERGLKGHNLDSEVLQEWEGIVNRVAKSETGEKVIVCGRSAKWWDSEIKEDYIEEAVIQESN